MIRQFGSLDHTLHTDPSIKTTANLCVLGRVLGEVAGSVKRPDPLAPGPEYLALAWLWFTVSVGYVPLSWRFLGGSPGQRVVGLRVVSGGTGRRLSGLACLGRFVVWFGCLVTVIPALATSILAARDAYRQTWPDKAVGSLVVRIGTPLEQPSPKAWDGASSSLQ